MSAFSGGPGPPSAFNLNNEVHHGNMPPLGSAVNKRKNNSYKALKSSFFTHPSDVEKYFVISGDAVKGMDIFDIQESLEKISKDDFKSCTILNSGDILVQTKNAQQIEALKATSAFGPDKQPVSVSENGVLNQSQALVRSKLLAKVAIEKITVKLADQKVVKVQRLQRKEGERWVDTATHLLTFNTPIIPRDVQCGVLNLRTEIYIPAPFRCVRCQKIGHTKKRCDPEKNKHICGNCANEFHEGVCSSPSKCVNCGNAHPSYSKLCQAYLDEKEINAIRVTERIPYSLARAEFRKRRRLPNSRTPVVSYSNVLQSPAAKAGTNQPDQVSQVVASSSENVLGSSHTSSLPKPSTSTSTSIETTPKTSLQKRGTLRTSFIKWKNKSLQQRRNSTTQKSTSSPITRKSIKRALQEISQSTNPHSLSTPSLTEKVLTTTTTDKPTDFNSSKNSHQVSNISEDDFDHQSTSHLSDSPPFTPSPCSSPPLPLPSTNIPPDIGDKMSEEEG